MIPTGTCRAFSRIPSEEIADGREVLHRLGRTDVPLPFDGRQRRQRFLLRDAEVADPWVVGGRDLLFPVVDRLLSDAQAELPLHVRLAAGDPNLADENVVEDDLVRPGDRQHERAAGQERRQMRQPFTVGAGRDGDRLFGDLHRDGFTRSRRAPDRHLRALLQHRVISEERVGGDCGVGNRCRAKECDRCGRQPTGEKRAKRVELHGIAGGQIQIRGIC